MVFWTNPRRVSNPSRVFVGKNEIVHRTPSQLGFTSFDYIYTMKHLALLRGINVSGHNMIKMEALKSTLEAIGFTNVVTYIQSGNVFVEADEESGFSVGFKIKQEIYKTFGHEVPVIGSIETLEIFVLSNKKNPRRVSNPSRVGPKNHKGFLRFSNFKMLVFESESRLLLGVSKL